MLHAKSQYQEAQRRLRGTNEMTENKTNLKLKNFHKNDEHPERNQRMGGHIIKEK